MVVKNQSLLCEYMEEFWILTRKNETLAFVLENVPNVDKLMRENWKHFIIWMQEMLKSVVALYSKCIIIAFFSSV